MSLSQHIISIIDTLHLKPFRALVSRDIFSYAICGATNMALDTLWYYIIYHYIVAERFINLGIIIISPHIASLLIAFPITLFTGFWLNRNVAFRVDKLPQGKQLVKYAISVIGSLLINYVCMKFFVEHLHIWATPSKMLTTVVCVIYSYLAAKYFTFRANRANLNNV